MKQAFKSRDFTFRPTSLSAAMLAAGLIQQPHLVREAKREGLLRGKHDRYNSQPSVHVPTLNADVRPDKASWKSEKAA